MDNVQPTYLYTPRRHLQLSSKRLSQGSVWLCLALERFLQEFELIARCSFAMLDFGGIVGVECAEVDGSRINAWRERNVGSCCHVRRGSSCVGGERSGRIGRVGRNVPLDGGANRRDVDALAWVV